VPQAFGFATLRHLPMQHPPQTLQLLAGQQTPPIHFLFHHVPGRRQAPSAQRPRRVLAQFPHEQLLRSLVDFVEILRHPLEPRRRPDRRPTRRLVGRATEPLHIHETLHQHDRMSVLGQPVLRQPGQVQGHRPTREVRVLPRLAQTAEARVVRHQVEPCASLVFVPPHPAIATFEMVRRRRPS
jgi:hypothetical protein